MTLDLDALEATAKAATPGPWRWDEDFGENGDTGLALTNDARAEVVGAYNWHCCSFRDDPTVEDNDAEHIAAFDPPTVLELIAKLREAREVLAGAGHTAAKYWRKMRVAEAEMHARELHHFEEEKLRAEAEAKLREAERDNDLLRVALEDRNDVR